METFPHLILKHLRYIKSTNQALTKHIMPPKITSFLRTLLALLNLDLRQDVYIKTARLRSWLEFNSPLSLLRPPSHID